jgi:hypothetical protein
MHPASMRFTPRYLLEYLIAHTKEPYRVGEFVANQILAARANDGSDAVALPPVGSGPGVWVPTPPAFLPYLLPQWDSSCRLE